MPPLLGFLALGQSLVSLRNSRRWRQFVRSNVPAVTARPLPPVTLIVPCRGREPGLAENLAAYAAQDYPDFELLFVMAPGDAAMQVARQAAEGARLLTVAPREDEGEKVTKLRHAVREARARSDIFVFGDSDGRPSRRWLRTLVGGLLDSNDTVAAVTGYRWYVVEAAGPHPRPVFPSIARSSWNSFIASFLDEDSAICWGGSTAIRRDVFERLEIARWWRGSVSDDYRLSGAVRRAGLKVRFIPACLVASHGDCTWSELLEWSLRQVRLTRVYAPRLWVLGLLAHGLYVAGCADLAWQVGASVRAGSAPWLAVGVAAGLVAANIASAAARLGAAGTALPADRHLLAETRLAFLLLAPLMPFLFFVNFAGAGFSRTLAWRGTRYRLAAPDHTVVLSRDDRRAAAAPAAVAEEK